MSTITQEYRKQMATLEESLNALQSIAISRAKEGNGTILEHIQELQTKLSCEEFYLAILGLFKRGKSTLINALLQSEVVPTGVLPVTSVITKIRYGDKQCAEILFNDGSIKDIAISELPEYVTERGNPRNSKGVLEAEVRLSSPILKGGITIIDTPGVGSTYLSGTESTYKFLERVDACLFVLAVDPPIGREELDLLKATKQYAKKLTFVLNKKDYVDRADLDEAVNFCRQVIESSLELENVTIYPLSAKSALEGYMEADSAKVTKSGIMQVTAVLDELLRSGKQEILVTSTAVKALKVAEDLLMSQEIAIKSAAMPLNELEQTIRELDDFLKTVESRRREIFYLLDGKSKEIVQMLDEDLECFKNERGSDFVAMLESHANERLESKMNLRDITTAMEAKLKETLVKTYSDFISSEDPRIEAKFSELVDGVSKQMNSLVEDAVQNVSELFGIKLDAPPTSVRLSTQHRFYYCVEPLFPSDPLFIGQMPMLLPKFLYKGALLKKVKAHAEEEFDRTAGRIRYDYFIIRMDKGILHLKRDLGRSLDSSILAAKNAALEGAKIRQESGEEVEKTLNELKEVLTVIHSVKNRLEEFLLFRKINLARQQPLLR